jgi:alanyl-tRNA synthetase
MSTSSQSAHRGSSGRPAHKTAAQVRQDFIDFFVERAGHRFIPSSPVVPHDDPTLMFANAGMNQFKPLFLGNVRPGSSLEGLTRAVNSQKCIRAGGKHNDLDDVGKDGYHHTFFEMLGNWSFGDYFKAESIQWGWELLTQVWGIDPGRLYATYFEGKKEQGLEPDREAYDLWRRHLPAGHIIPGNMKDNFWEMGDTGPCGPCSEIHYDGRSDEDRAKVPGDTLVNQSHGEVIEIWNHVFIQFNREAGGKLVPLPAKHVDTGMGLERVVRVLQGKNSNYDTDAFTPLFEAIQRVCRAAPYGARWDSQADTAYRVIADHVRTLTFAITDGAEPSNEGRGYVLRRILRRAVRYGRQTLGVPGVFLCEIVPTVVETMGAFFPELKKNPEHVMRVIRDEEEAFGRTWGQGVRMATQDMDRREQLILPRLEGFEQVSEQVRQATQRFAANFADVSAGMQAAIAPLTSVVADIRGAIDRMQENVQRIVQPLAPMLAEISKHIDNVLAEAARTKEKINNHPDPLVRRQMLEFFEQMEVPMLLEFRNLGDDAGVISSDVAFKLHDTYGFPIDLTQLMAEERGMTVDVAGFNLLMEQARELARSGGKDDESSKLLLGTSAIARLKALNARPTDDSDKFHGRNVRARVVAIWNGHDFDESLHASNTRPTDRFAIVLDKTCFYAEMGGQVADTGHIAAVMGGATDFVVESVKNCGGYIVHIGQMKKGDLKVGMNVEARLDSAHRAAVASNHTATHLLNLALRATLGDKVDQKGSLVAPERLRFDFSSPGAMNEAQLEAVQSRVRAEIARDLPVYAEVTALAPAKGISGLRAVFGEAYPDPVRVVSIGATVAEMLGNPTSERWREHSIEFCGGTHVSATGEIGSFVLVGEEAVSKGVRRVTALTGDSAKAADALAEGLSARVRGAGELSDAHLPAEVGALATEIDRAEIGLVRKGELRKLLAVLQERVKQANKAAAGAGREKAVAAAREIAERASAVVIVEMMPAGSDRDAMLAGLHVVQSKHAASAVMLLSADEVEKKVTIVASVPPGLVAKGLKAGDWVREASVAVGGKGGGRPDAAQGGGSEVGKVGEAVKVAVAFAGGKV